MKHIKIKKKTDSDHKWIKASVKVTLHGGEIYKDNPENVITDNGKLIAVANDDKAGNNSPQAQEKRNHGEFNVYIGDRVKNQMVEIQQEENFLQSNQAIKKPE